MNTAKDIMTQNVIFVKKETPIFEAVELMVKRNITGLPVVDENMTLVAILSEKDVLRLLFENENSENLTVNDFMTQPAIFFDENESFDDICQCLSENYFRRVPVTTKGKLVGIISRSDIIREILKKRSS